ncbi:MAG TPA: DUF2934 domain-containing protein [Terriglobales bacterium]|nr:DUF2934 domain-containing protein [Terriglobales bacterium]
MAKARTPRTTSSVTPINRKPSEVKEMRKSSGNGNLEEEIRRRAYELFQERGGEHGRHHEDWLRAEAEVRARYANRTA